MEAVDQQEIRVKVEDAREIYVGPAAIEAIRAEANRQADTHLRAAIELWDDCDVEDLEEVKQVAFKLSMAQDAISALLHLAPVPDEVDEQ